LRPVYVSGFETWFSRVFFCLIMSKNVGKCLDLSRKGL
jgi:hypothetical protein